MNKPLSLLFCLMLWAGSIAAEAETTQAKLPPLNPLAAALGQLGVSTCQGRVHQVANFLSGKSDSGAVLLLPPDRNHINDHLITASMEIFDGAHTFYSSMDFSPSVAAGCDATYETIIYWPNNCDSVAKTQFAEAKQAGKMRKQIPYLTYGDSLQIFLMPAGSGCVSIKKQAVWERL